MRFLVSAVVALLIAALCFAAFPRSATSGFASASPILPVGDAEYANGTITEANSLLKIWYDWVNVSGTQVVCYAEYTDPAYPYPGPVVSLVGQHLQLADGSEVFVASALDKMEVYRDLNGDGIPQGNFTSDESEIMYYMFMNMSDSCSVVPIQKTLEDDVPHYQWGFRYEHVYAYFLHPTPTGGIDTVAKLIFDHITLGFDFSVNGNVSNLKTNFDIGKVASIDMFDSPEFSLDGLSLSLLYTTSTYASKSYSTYVNGQPYNSTTAENSTIDAEIAQVKVEDAKAYDFVFGGNYTVNREESNETYQVNIETYEAKAEAVALSVLPIKIYRPVLWQTSFFRDQLNLTNLFGGSWPDVALDYNASSLIYRICFPVWDGMQIVHDPVYVGYVSSTTIPEFPTTAIGVVLVGVTVLALATVKARKGFFAQKR